MSAADLASALPTAGELRPISGNTWYEGPISTLSGMQPGFPADPQIATYYGSATGIGPLTVTLSVLPDPAEAVRLADASATSGAGGGAIASAPGLGDRNWVYLDRNGTSDVSCTVRWVAGRVVSRLSLDRAAPSAAGTPCTVEALAAVITIAKGMVERSVAVLAGRRRAQPVPAELAPLLPSDPAGARRLGTTVQSSSAWAVGQAIALQPDLSTAKAMEPFRYYNQMLGLGGAKQMSTTTWAIQDTLLVGQVAVFRTPDGAKAWADDVVSDNPPNQTPITIPRVDAGHLVRVTTGSGADAKVLNIEARLSVGRNALSLFCERALDNEPLVAAAACGAAIDQTMRSWVSRIKR